MLEVRALHKAYGKSVAVKGASFSIPRGICFGLLGPNGAGKTTTISIITGTLNADRGEVLLKGQIVRVDAHDVKRGIGYVPQDLALYEDLTALENLRFFGMLYGLDSALLAKRIEESLEISGLKDRRKEPVRTFSGGMKRRLNIAAALLHDPELLVLDEPTVGVDPQSRNLIFEALTALLARGKTLLYTTHYMEEVERLCDRVAIMDQGQVIAEGSLNDLYRLTPKRCMVQIELEKPVEDSLSVLPGTVSSMPGSSSLTFEMEDLTDDLPQVLERIRAGGGTLESVRTERPSLEQVFLHLTGRTLRD